MGKYSDLYLKEHQNGVAQRNSVTQRVTSQPKSSQVVQTPVNNRPDFATGVSNLTHAIGQGVQENFVKPLQEDPLGYTGNLINSLAIQPAKEILSSPMKLTAPNKPYPTLEELRTKPIEQIQKEYPQELTPGQDFMNMYGKNNIGTAMLGGIVKGAVALPQNLWNFGVDIANAYNETPEQNQNKLHYVEDVANALNGNKVYQDVYKGAKQNYPTIQEFSSYAPAMYGLDKVAKIGNIAQKAQTASKVAKATPKITQELNARVSPKAAAKYREQIERMAADRAKQQVLANQPKQSLAKDVFNHTTKGALLGATEGETLQERAGNAVSMGALGFGLSFVPGVAKKGWNSEKGLEFRKNAADTLKQATDSYDWVSRTAAGIDATLNTNLSNNANGLTKIRRDYLKLRMANPSIAKMISPEQFKALVEAKKLTPEEYKELFETAKYGSRERAYNLAKQLEQRLEKDEAKETTQKYEQPIEQSTKKVEADIEGFKHAIQFNDVDGLKNSIKTKENADEIISKAIDQLTSANKAIKEAGIENALSSDIIRKNDAKKFIKEIQKIYDELPSEKELKNTNEVTEVVQENKKVNSSTDDLSHVKSETDINTPSDIKTSQIKQQNNTQNKKYKSKQPKLKDNQYIDEDGAIVTRLEPGMAEGAGDLYKLTAEKDENIYKDIDKDYPDNRAENMDEAHQNKLKRFQEKYDVIEDPKTNKYIIVNKSTGKPITPEQKKALREYFKEYKENSRELTQDERARAEIEESIEDDTYYDKYNDKSISEREVEENPVHKYKTNDQEFISWYDEYSKKTPNDKVKFLQKKLESFKNKEEQADFYNKFTEQGERESNSKRAKNLGDEYYDTSNVDEVEHLTEASKGVNTKLERTPDEVQTEKNSANFQKVVDSTWEKNFRKGRMNAKGRLQAKRDSASIQQEYDSIVNEIKALKNTSAKIKQAMIKELNDIADTVVEGKKKFGVKLNKSSNENLNLESDAVNKLIEANENKDLARGKAIIDEAGLKAEYLDEKGRKALQEHYMQSAEKANARLAELGMEVNVDRNGNISVNLNEQKAVKWAKDQSKIRNAGNQVKLYKDLRHLDKHPETAVLRAKEEAKKILKANSRIIANDIINAFEKPQKSLKEIEGAKGTDKQYEYRETGDTWAKDSSDVDYGTRRARQTVEGLQKASEVQDNSYKAIGELGKKLSEQGKVTGYKRVIDYFKNSKLGTTAKTIFNRHKDAGICEVKDGTLADGSAYRIKSDEVFVEKGLPEAEKIARAAHEFAHRDIALAIKEGGKKAVNMAYEVFNEMLKPEQAVAKLREAVNNNIKANYKYQIEYNKLAERYGKDFVDETLDECEKLIEQGKTARVLSSDKRKIFNSLSKVNTASPIEDYCYKIENEVRNEQREFGRRTNNVHTTKEVQRAESNEGNGRTGSSEQSKSKVESSDRTSERSVQEEGLELSTRFGRMLNWFDKNKSKAPAFYETFKQASSEKMKNLSDFYNNVSDSAEKLLLKYHRYTKERMKGRLLKQSKTGEGIYFLQGSEKSDRIVWKEDNGSSKYIKKLDGVKQKGTAEQAIARNLQRLAKMQHADACVSFLKEHFKEKKEGYVPVNSDLLFTGMVEGKSRAWLKTLMEGEDSIRKTFDVNDAAEWTELYKTTDGGKADIYLPKDILAETLTGEKELALDYISTYSKRGLDGKVRGYAKLAGAMLDFYNDRFKRLVLTSGSFVFNNVMGNNIMLFANAESPADYIRSIGDAFKLKDEQIPPEVLESTLAKSIMQEMQGGRKYFSEKDGTLNTIARLIDGDLIDIKANDLHGLKRVGAHLVNWGIARPNGVFRAISNAVGKINDGFERFSRKQAYSIVLRKINKQKMIKTAASMKGIEALAEAAKDNKVLRQTVVDKVEDILGDYNNFTNVEKKFFKRVFPFYAWNRTITRHIVHLAKDDPAMAFMVMYQTFRLLNQDDDLEDYQHGALKTKMYNQKTKSNIVWNKANMIPYNTLFQMVTGEDHERIGTMSSAFTKPAEAIRGKKFFLDQEITSKDYKKVSVDGKSGYMNTKTGEFKEGEAPFKVRAGYLGRDLLEKTYPMVGSPLTKSLKDKQFDASLGGYNHGDYIGEVKTSKGYKKKYRAAKNRLDTKYKLMNRVTGGWQPEHKVSKEQKEKYQQQRKRMRGY